MLRRQFDARKPYRYVRYARMSSERQNERSPDQQFEEIARTLQRLDYPWVHVQDYRDDAVSGQYMLKREGFQRMLEDIRSGAVQIDLVLVHTHERLGRSDEVHGIIQELRNRHGVLVLTADGNFADPTTPQGKVMGMFESLRATEENRVKAVQVLRGKRDAARQGKWPGGRPPFGYRLRSILCDRNGRQGVDYSVLEPDPEASWIIKLLFSKAQETGWGTTRLAKYLNARADIPERFKPFQPTTVGTWLGVCPSNPWFSSAAGHCSWPVAVE